jgi:hypothetical protein
MGHRVRHFTVVLTMDTKSSPDGFTWIRRHWTAELVGSLRRMTGPERVAYYESLETRDAPVDDSAGRARFDQARHAIIRH